MSTGRDHVGRLPLRRVALLAVIVAILGVGLRFVVHVRPTGGGVAQAQSWSALGADRRAAREKPLSPKIQSATPATSTLIVYDVGRRAFGWLGEGYATEIANLASHFGSWRAVTTRSYRKGMIDRFTATVYVGTVPGERLPTSFEDDVLRSRRPVIWLNANIGQVYAREPWEFQRRYGWTPGTLDTRTYPWVLYNGVRFTRDVEYLTGLRTCRHIDRRRARVLATALDGKHHRLPWAVRGGGLTYIGEIPLNFLRETDRALIFADLLFPALAPKTRPRHRVIIRLEDISPLSDPDQLRAVADYLFKRHIPFGFGVIPYYRDPRGYGNAGISRFVPIDRRPGVVAALRYMETHGGVLVDHGYTHQWDGGRNPNSEISGDDYEFFRVTHQGFVGPIPGDSGARAAGRMKRAISALVQVGLGRPSIFEFPHYAASVPDYLAAHRLFNVRWERPVYFPGILSGSSPMYRHPFTQAFPYVVRDVYGSKVLPENLGYIQLEPLKDQRLPAVALAAARRLRVVRDSVAGFFFHPFLPLRYLDSVVRGLRSQGWVFVSPASI